MIEIDEQLFLEGYTSGIPTLDDVEHTEQLREQVYAQMMGWA